MSDATCIKHLLSDDMSFCPFCRIEELEGAEQALEDSDDERFKLEGEVEELRARLEAVGKLPVTRGRMSIVSPQTFGITPVGRWVDADELEAILQQDGPCTHPNTEPASAIRGASVWCPDCEKWVVLSEPPAY